MRRPVRSGGVDPGRADARPRAAVLGPGGDRPVRPAVPAGGRGVSGGRHRRRGHAAGGRPGGRGGPRHRPRPATWRPLAPFLGARGAEIVADATGVPDAVPVAMSLACDAGQVVVVGSPRGKAKDVNFYDDLHRRYIGPAGSRRDRRRSRGRPARSSPSPWGPSSAPRPRGRDRGRAPRRGSARRPSDRPAARRRGSGGSGCSSARRFPA